MAEVLIRNAAELDAAFQPCPAWFDTLHGHFKAIADELRPMMPDSTPYTITIDPPMRTPNGWGMPRMEYSVEGSRVYCNLEFKEVYTSSSWRARPTGKYYVSVGRYGGMKTFPQRKDGTFNYKGIAEVLHQQGIITLNEGRDRRVKNSNDDMAKTLLKEFPWAGEMVKTSYWFRGGRTNREIVAPLGHVFLDFGKLKLQPHQAAKVLEVLQDVLGKGA